MTGRHHQPKHRWFQFKLRSLFWLAMIVALAVGWWVDHRRQAKVIEDLRDPEPKFDFFWDDVRHP